MSFDSSMKLAIGSDHAGVKLKDFLISKLEEQGIETIDCGAYSESSVDYPDIAAKTCEFVNSGEAECAILICGTGIGISISANKIDGIRAALVNEEYSARMSRKHNNANVVCLGARTTGPDLAWSLVQAFLEEDFEGGRHEARVEKIMNLEK